MSDLTLVIMAAGMGSRFGGLKQIESVGPSGEFIIDYSIYDAIINGFNKIVFIVKKENLDLFRDTIGKRIEKKIVVEYVFQDIFNIPDFVNVPNNRTKPWGTAHAIYSLSDKVKGNFAVINADDFYGRESFKVIREFFKTNKENEYLIVGYKTKNVLSKEGAVKRGVCEVDNNNCLVKLIESSVEKTNNKIIAKPLDNSNSFEIKEDTLMAMNMFGFNDSVLQYLNKDINNFFIKNKDNLDSCEYLMPEVVISMVKDNLIKAKVIKTTAKWQGITYKEDKDILVSEINYLITKGVYPNNLWK